MSQDWTHFHLFHFPLHRLQGVAQLISSPSLLLPAQVLHGAHRLRSGGSSAGEQRSCRQAGEREAAEENSTHLLHLQHADGGPVDLQDAVGRVDGIPHVRADMHPVNPVHGNDRLAQESA